MPTASDAQGLQISGRKGLLDLSPLRLHELEPPVGVDPEELPPEFGDMGKELKSYLSDSTSTSSHRRLADRNNTYWVAVPSASTKQGLQGIVVSMPMGQMPGPRDHLVLRRPHENRPSRWVEVSPVGAVRLPPEIVDRVLSKASTDGVVYLGMLAI